MQKLYDITKTWFEFKYYVDEMAKLIKENTHLIQWDWANGRPILNEIGFFLAPLSNSQIPALMMQYCVCQLNRFLGLNLNPNGNTWCEQFVGQSLSNRTTDIPIPFQNSNCLSNKNIFVWVLTCHWYIMDYLATKHKIIENNNNTNNNTNNDTNNNTNHDTNHDINHGISHHTNYYVEYDASYHAGNDTTQLVYL
jgi:hypothetical protein